MLYRWLIRPILFRLDPETAHRLAIIGMKLRWQLFDGWRWWLVGKCDRWLERHGGK